MRKLFLTLLLICYAQFEVGGQSKILVKELSNAKKIVFSVISFYDVDIDTKLKRSDINEANFFHELCDDYPFAKIDSITLTSVVVTKNTERLFLNAPSNIITDEIRKAINDLEYFDKFFFYIEFNSKDNVKDGFIESFIIMPEKEAIFRNGTQNLIQYFEKKTVGELDIKKWKRNRSFSANFSVSTEGEIVDIESRSDLKDKELDSFFMNMLIKMPDWSPALDINGNPVKQGGFRLNISLEDI